MSASFAMAFPLGFAGLAAVIGLTSPRAALLTASVILTASVLFAAVGLACSLRFPSGAAGAGASVAIVLASRLGVPAAALQLEGDHRWPPALASPMTAAFYALGDESVWGGQPPPGEGLAEEPPPAWGRLARGAGAWMIAEGLAAAGLAAWCRRRIEGGYRVRQRPRQGARVDAPRRTSPVQNPASDVKLLPMPACGPCPRSEALADYALGDLRGPEKDEVQRHLRDCETCARSYSILQATTATIRGPER